MNHEHVIKTLLTIVGLLVGMVSYTFTTFETKDNIKANVTERLDRIENKLDRVIESR